MRSKSIFALTVCALLAGVTVATACDLHPAANNATLPDIKGALESPTADAAMLMGGSTGDGQISDAALAVRAQEQNSAAATPSFKNDAIESQTYGFAATRHDQPNSAKN
jgi:hypothetical protein